MPFDSDKIWEYCGRKQQPKIITAELQDGETLKYGERREPFKISVIIDEQKGTIIIRAPQAETWNEAPGEGEPVMIEHYNGKLHLHAWDGSQEDPICQAEWELKYPQRKEE